MTVCRFHNIMLLFGLQHKKARHFLDDRHAWSDPFFMMLSTPACHAPFTPAPQYNTSFANKTAPRDASYNVKGQVSLLYSYQISKKKVKFILNP